jgi:polyhydroxyalkanoate synthesis regulator phasin
MKNNQEYITELCQILFSQGKNPTVALLRSQANRTLFIPDVIKGLQRWKQNPHALDNVKVSVKNSTSETQQTLTERVQQLERQVAEISAQLNALLHKKD